MPPKIYSLKPAALKAIPFFASFSSKQLSEILDDLPSQTFGAGQIILKQGKLSDFFYLVLEGSVKVQREDSSGALYTLGELGMGRMCGEISLLRGEPSSVTVTAVSDANLLAVSRSAMLDIIRAAEPEQMLNILFLTNNEMRLSSERGFREVLARKMLSSQVEVEKQRALTQMSAGVAHEINTPLGVINTAVNVMARELATAPREMTAMRAAEIAESLELMRLNVERADNLLQGFKKVSISQLTDERDTFDLVEVVNETISLIAVRLKQSQIRIKFNNELAADQKRWVGYRGLLSQVLINLLTNVERYAYPNGIGGVAEVTLRSENEKNFSISVRDAGRGISKENQARIFEPFFTTGKAIGGTGLGLSIIQNIVVNLLKGRIRFDSEEGKGTEFLVIFPKEVP